MKKIIVFSFIFCFLYLLAYADDYDSQFMWQNVPTTLAIGQKKVVYVNFKNTGTMPWTSAALIRLGSQNPRDNWTWGFNRVYLNSTESITTGSSKTFKFTITAPSTPGSYNFQWRMVKEGVKWFGAYSSNKVINVVLPDYDAQFISQSVPTTMAAGETYPVSITFKNTGTESWMSSDMIRLGSRNPANNETWGLKRVYLGTDVIAPNETKVFNFTVTAPSTGTYNFQWQMLQEMVKWFGDTSTNVVVNVTGSTAVGVNIIDPIAEAYLSGTVPVTVNLTGDIVRADFYLDGCLFDSVTSSLSSSYTFTWDTTENHLPVPHSSLVDYGYYGVVGVHTDEQIHFDYTSEVNGYTNFYSASRAAYKYTPDSEWIPMMTSDIANAAANNRRIALSLCLNDSVYSADPNHLDNVLNIAAPHWNYITRVEVLHEPNNWADIGPTITQIQQELVNRGLASRPMGIVVGPESTILDYLDYIPNLDWVGIEAYIEAPGSDISQENIDELNATLTAAMNKVPSDKNIVLIMMAYTRGGAWENLDTLRDLQVPTYLKACEDERVVTLRMFSYHRPAAGANAGTRENPQLITPHKLIAEKLLGITLYPPDGPAVNGRRTIRVKVYNSLGYTAEDLVVVNVDN